MTRFRSLTLVVAVLLLAGGALTGIHLLNTSAIAPLPAQLSTSDAGGKPTVAPVEQVPAAPAPEVSPAPGGSGSPGNPGPLHNTAPAQRPTSAQPDGGSGSGGPEQGPDHTWAGGPDRWHARDPDGFPRRDQYPFRDRQPGFGQPGSGQQPGVGQYGSGQYGSGQQTPGSTPTQRDRARQQVAYAICDRYHLPRDRCQIEPTGR